MLRVSFSVVVNRPLLYVFPRVSYTTKQKTHFSQRIIVSDLFEGGVISEIHKVSELKTGYQLVPVRTGMTEVLKHDLDSRTLTPVNLGGRKLLFVQNPFRDLGVPTLPSLVSSQ